MIIFVDGDDTLWQTGHMYDQARQEFAEIVGEASGHPAKEIYDFHIALDVRNIAKSGFGKDRFADSMLIAARHYLGTIPAAMEQQLWTIGHSPFTLVSPVQPHADYFLHAFKAADIPVVLLTAGDPDIQNQRVQAFPLRNLLYAARIVDYKDAQELRAAVEDYGYCRDNTWMVGNSYESDIKPALEVGVHPAWLKTYAWAFDTQSHMDEDGVFIADDLKTIADHILEEA
jgi:putative hydrolase of the HAD superfamily